MTVIYYMRGVVVTDEHDQQSTWSVNGKRTETNGLPPGFLPKPKTGGQQRSTGATQLRRRHLPHIDTRHLKRGKRAHKSPKSSQKQGA